MTNKDWINFLAIFLGPLLAVGITLWHDARRRTKEQQTQTLRMLLSTRHLPSDPAYSTAINLIPIDFNKVTNVMSAWNTYMEKIRVAVVPDAEFAQSQEILSKQTKLIFAMTQHLSYKLSESDISITAYAANGFITRDNMWLNALAAWPRIADTLEKQTAAIIPHQTVVSSENA